MRREIRCARPRLPANGFLSGTDFELDKLVRAQFRLRWGDTSRGFPLGISVDIGGLEIASLDLGSGLITGDYSLQTKGKTGL